MHKSAEVMHRVSLWITQKSIDTGRASTQISDRRHRQSEGVASPISFPPLESVTVGGNSYHRNERKLLIVVMKSPSV